MNCLHLIVFALSLFSWRVSAEQEDVRDQKVIDLVNFVLSSSESGISTNLMKPIEIIDAQSQVVSGVKHTLTFAVAETGCDRSNVAYADIEECEILENGARRICRAEVWEQSWRNLKKVLSHTCQ